LRIIIRSSLVITFIAVIIVSASLGLGLINPTQGANTQSSIIQETNSTISSLPFTSSTITRVVTAPPLSLEDRFGPEVTSLSIAQGYINATGLKVDVSAAIVEPSYLPVGLSLIQIRAETGSVTLVYNGTAVAPLQSYSDKVSMIVAMQQDGSFYYVPSSSYLQKEILTKNLTTTTETITISEATITNPSFANVTIATINGYPGWGQYGFLQWWAFGIHYSIVANLPLSALIQVADSMRTQVFTVMVALMMGENFKQGSYRLDPRDTHCREAAPMDTASPCL
jgi:hypothetical protein